MYYDKFYYLEGEGLLDPGNDNHIWCLQHVFMTPLNRDLDWFKNSWNYHPLSSVSHQAPIKLFVKGAFGILRSGAGRTGLSDFLSTPGRFIIPAFEPITEEITDVREYGATGPLRIDTDPNPQRRFHPEADVHVVVPPRPPCPFSQSQFDAIRDTIIREEVKGLKVYQTFIEGLRFFGLE